jgi:hypothetical protein
MDKFQPINIYSGSNDKLGASLTFPTTLSYRKRRIDKQFPIRDKNGKVYPDAEAAYKTFKSKVNGEENKLKLYVKIAVAKFEQYPELVEEITKRGGVEWLATCEHKTYAKTKSFKWWEGVGVESPMIRCLIEAYKLVTER